MLDHTDWRSLHHACGTAEDVPDQLAELLGGDGDARARALAFLDGALLHGGSVYSATGPAARFVAAALPDSRLGVRLPAHPEAPVRALLISWLGRVAAACTDLPPDAQNCRSVLPLAYRATATFADDPDPAVRAAVRGAVAAMLTCADLVEHRAVHAERLRAEAAGAPPGDRAAIAAILGAWGLAPVAALTDPDPMVRAAAAVAPALDGDARALAEVRAALRAPDAVDGWFPEPLPGHAGSFRFVLVAALLRRTDDFDAIAEEAVAVARASYAGAVDGDWGPLLGRAFPRPYDGRALSAGRRAFLAAIVGNDRCWGVFNPLAWLSRAGLPADRNGLRGLTTG